MRFAGKALLLLSVGACTRTPERLRLGSSDTIVVNSRQPVALPVHGRVVHPLIRRQLRRIFDDRESVLRRELGERPCAQISA